MHFNLDFTKKVSSSYTIFRARNSPIMIDVTVNQSKKLRVERKEQIVEIDGTSSNFEAIKNTATSYKVLSKDSIYTIDVIKHEQKELVLLINGAVVNVTISDHIDQILEKLGMDLVQANAVKEVKAPMPGSILDILVKEGDEVKENDQLLVLEAMKMENVIKSPGDGTVGKVHISRKQNVEKNQVLISFE